MGVRSTIKLGGLSAEDLKAIAQFNRIVMNYLKMVRIKNNSK
jgi:hypothetical protein